MLAPEFRSVVLQAFCDNIIIIKICSLLSHILITRGSQEWARLGHAA